MPKAMVRLSAGRRTLSREAQLLCFMAGANSIFYGDKLLTTANPEEDADKKLMADAGLKPMAPYASTDPIVQQTRARGPKVKARLDVLGGAAE